MNVALLQITPNAEQLIEKIGRVCYDSAHLIKKDSHERFIKNLIERGHDSVLEHGVVTFHIDGVSRSLSHQLVRHRIASYTQKSQRYCREDQFDYVTPPGFFHGTTECIIYEQAMNHAQEAYNDLIKQGVRPEDARMVLPNACCTEITVTMNFRSLRNFFKLRLDKHAQWEIRELAKQMLALVMLECPTVFQDIYDQYFVEQA